MATRRLPLDQVAEIRDDRCEHIGIAELKMRAGQFSYLGEQSEYLPFDDYQLEGCHLILGAFCNVRSPQGNFSTLLTQGKITPSNLYHVLRCETEADTRYLRHVLANTPAAPCLTGSSLAERLEIVNLRSLMIPWPDAEQRHIFLRAMDLLEQEMEQGPAQVDALLRFGDGLFSKNFPEEASAGSLLITLRPGSSRPLDASFDSSRIPVFGTHGLIGSTARAHTEGPALLFGQLGAVPLVSYCSSPVAVSAQMRFCQTDDAPLPLAYLFFALRHRGAVASPRELRHRSAGQTRAFEVQEDLGFEGASEAEASAFATKTAPLLAHIDLLEQRQWALREYRQLLWRWLSFHADQYPAGDVTARAQSLPQKTVPAFPPSHDKAIACEIIPLLRRGSVDVAGDGVVYSEAPAAPESLLIYYDVLVANLAEQDTIPDAEDLIWEFLPLAFLRLHLGRERFYDLAMRVRGRAGDQGNERDYLVASLDAALEDIAAHDERLGFLRQLGYRDSLLSSRQLVLTLQSLAELEDAVLTAASLANLYAHCAVALQLSQPSPQPPLAPPPLPAAVRALLEALIACEFESRRKPHKQPDRQRVDAAKAISLYDPCAGTGELTLLAQRVTSAAHATLCTTDFAQSLFLQLACWQEGVESDIQAQAALNSPLPMRRAQLVTGFLPPDKGRWTDDAPDGEDRRWVFGPPPPARPQYAWIQQAISVMDESAFALLLVPDAALHTMVPAEIPLRKRLAQSGLIKAVIALPGRLFAGRRTPVSILLIEKDEYVPLREILFVDAQSLGCESATTPDRRVLPSEVVKRVLAVYRRHGRSDFQDDWDTDGFARVVSLSEVEAHGNLLTPWTYLQQDTSVADHAPINSTEHYRTLRTQRLKAQNDLTDYLGALSSLK
jgi:hypothetical protein